jgi:hypothetical protein
MVQETYAVASNMAEVEKKGSSNALINAVASAMKSVKKEDLTPPAELKNTADVRTYALKRIREVAALVDKKAPAQEAQEFKQWLASLGPKVAGAAKEGGFLGFGGTLVTAEETAAVNELAAALGVKPPPPTAA